MSEPTHNIIAFWPFSIATIPIGWKLCDGTNYTPDLEFRMIIGAGGSHTPDDIGGTENHVHNFTGDDHSHRLRAGSDIQAGANFDRNTDLAPVVGTVDAIGIIYPPWLTLHAIMKT